MIKRIAVLGLCLVACVFAFFTGCDESDDQCVMEAEKAVTEPEYDPNVAVTSRANSRSENITSGGKYVGKMYAGNTITWFFTAEKQANCDVRIAVANAVADSPSFIAGEGKVFSVTLNGGEIGLPQYEIAEGTQYFDNWQVLKLGNLRLEKGINQLVYTALSDTERLNVDYLSVSSIRANVKEHNHYWKSSSVAATCTEGGVIQKICDDCGYIFSSGLISAPGHKYGNYHYHDELMKMVSVCERCGDTITANTPNSKYFGEVYYDEGDFSTRPDEIIYEAEDAFVCLEGGLNNGSTYINKDSGKTNNPSGGKLVENISKVGNYIRFRVDAKTACKADLVFRMSNTMYSETGIASLAPMSDYVYCTVNGVDVDFTFVSFPGFDKHDYFEWRYVVIKDVDMTSEVNIIDIGPKDNQRHWISMPNTDVLKIYTDGAELKAVKNYNINDVLCGEYEGGYGYSLDFEKDDDFVLYAGEYTERADYVLTVQSEAQIANLAKTFDLTVNDATVNLEGVTLDKGINILVLKDVPVRVLKNTVSYTQSDEIKLLSVKAYTPEPLAAALDCAIDDEYDYLNNKGQENAKVPSLVFEAEDADLGDSISSRNGVDLIEIDINENTGKPASGNSAVGNFAVKGNTLTWRFISTEEVLADIAFMFASANFSDKVNGNTLTDNLQNRITVKINGVAVKLDDIVLTVDSIANYYDWKALTVCGIKLNCGVNEITVEALEYGAPNMDVMYVYCEDTQLQPV